MDKLERVARAIAYSGAVPEHREWEELLPETRRHYLQQAQAAIAALEPVTVRTLTAAECTNIVEATEPAEMTEEGDRRWTRRMGEALARALAERGKKEP